MDGAINGLQGWIDCFTKTSLKGVVRGTGVFEAGDIDENPKLQEAYNLVLFYTTFSNSYSYVPIGYIEDVTGIQEALGRGSVEVTFSIND